MKKSKFSEIQIVAILKQGDSGRRPPAFSSRVI